MAAVVVQSRFAGLKIEDDDYQPSVDTQKPKKSKINTNTTTTITNTNTSSNSNTNTAKKSEPQKKNKNNTKSQSANKKKKLKSAPVPANQWELWKQKDEELVDGNYETDLQQAILLSKLDYEEKKDVYKQIKKVSEIDKNTTEQNLRTTSKKQKKKNVMSLEQFNGMVNSGEEYKFHHEDEKDSVESKKVEKDEEFFERVRDDTKNELMKDKINDMVKTRLNVPEEVITRVQFADALEQKDKEIFSLNQEIVDLKQELLKVKYRNRKLCNLLGQGEMKDKAEILIEVGKLRSVQAELTAEIETLHTDLEKERSKNTDPRAKDKKKKGANSEKDK